jgi:hypothetical protein
LLLGYCKENTVRPGASAHNTQEAEIRRIAVRSHPGQIVQETLSISKKPFTKIGLVEWLW